MFAKRFNLSLMVALFSISFAAAAKLINISLQQKLASFENATGVKIGAAAINTADDIYLQYRATLQFSLCSQ